MNFFLYSKCGEGAGILKRLQDEGNNCSMYIQEKDYSNVYDGILTSTDYPEDNDIIIFDSSGNGVKADSFKKEGFKVFGASSFADKLEDDREFGLEFMLNHGIMIPDTFKFTSFKEGVNHVKTNKKTKFVFKPSGKNIPCKLTYSSADMEDMISYMTFVEKNFGQEIEDFVLQEFLEGAIISSEYWVGKNGFIYGSFNQTIEVKKFMNDNLGPSTGCSGNIVWPEDESNSIIAEMLRRVESDLISENYIGPIDLNTIVNEEGIYGLEWTPRFGLDAICSLMQLINQDLGKIIYDSFEEDSEINLLTCFSGGARLSIPPYPIEPVGKSGLRDTQKNSPNMGIPIRGLEKYEDNCYFYEIMKKDGQVVHSNGTGVIACISDVAIDPESCYDLVYQILEDCKVPDKQYRTDLGKTLSKMHEEVKEVLETVWS
jgi:phosphoribosylamine--glycine ligase